MIRRPYRRTYPRCKPTTCGGVVPIPIPVIPILPIPVTPIIPTCLVTNCTGVMPKVKLPFGNIYP